MLTFRFADYTVLIENSLGYSIYLQKDYELSEELDKIIKTIWVQNDITGETKKLLVSNPFCESNGSSKNEICNINKCWLLPADSIRGLRVIVQGVNDEGSIESSIVFEKTDSIIKLPCNAGVLGLTLDEDLIIAQSSVEYKQGGQYNIVHAFDYEGRELRSMATNLHPDISEEEEYFNNFLSHPRDLFEGKTFANTLYQEASITTHSKSRGIILFLHGTNGKGSDNQKPLQLEPGPSEIAKYLINKKLFDYYILVPQLATGSWVEQSDNLMSLIVNYLRTDSLVDINSIYICGTSLGAGGTWNMLKRFPNFFRGAMPVAMPMSGKASDYKGTRICYVTGAAEGNRQQDANSLTAVGIDVKYWYRPDANHGWTCQSSFTDDCLDWLFQ